MTEFKKGIQGVDDVKQTAESIQRFLSPMMTPNLHNDAEGTALALWNKAKQVTSELMKRTKKLRAKALEEDPNKQIYNELMCEKILALFSEACLLLVESFHVPGEALELWANAELDDKSPAAVQDLPNHWDSMSDVMTELMARHEAEVVRRVQRDQWNEGLSRTVGEVTAREADMRTCIIVELKDEDKRLYREWIESRRGARLAEEARETAMWNSELQRREIERNAATGDVTIRGSADHATRSLIKRVHNLLREVIAHPEREEIRTLRNAHLSVVKDFGHPAVWCGGDSAASSTCECPMLVATAEGLLRSIGYAVTYNTKPQPWNLLIQSHFHESASGKDRSALHICGRRVSEHTYHPIGFENYGERLLVLVEPNPLTDVDLWCQWHEALGALDKKLTAMLADT